MSAINRILRTAVLCAASVIFATSSTCAASPGTKTYHVLYAFTGGADGGAPYGGVVRDKTGNLYGTASEGGANGYGVVFKIDSSGVETVLYAFKGSTDGAYPASLIEDKSGNFYGTTTGGDAAGDYGTVFKLAAGGTETPLYRFKGGNDGEYPNRNLIAKNGNLFGTTPYGDTGCNGAGCGIVFKIASDGTETILYSFLGGTDGERPESGVIFDTSGNLYGTTNRGGASGIGTVYKIDQNGTESLLHSFAGGSDGRYPSASLIIDANRNLYGTTAAGGNGCSNGGCGTVFKLARDGTLTILYAFRGSAQKDGFEPDGSLIVDGSGNFYSTTTFGGKVNCPAGYSMNCGTIFKLGTDGTETTLHNFGSASDGAQPNGSLIADKKSHLYGAAIAGGGTTGCFSQGCGVVFETKE